MLAPFALSFLRPCRGLPAQCAYHRDLLQPPGVGGRTVCKPFGGFRSISFDTDTDQA